MGEPPAAASMAACVSSTSAHISGAMRSSIRWSSGGRSGTNVSRIASVDVIATPWSIMSRKVAATSGLSRSSVRRLAIMVDGHSSGCLSAT